jgi:hypothetical protein
MERIKRNCPSCGKEDYVYKEALDRGIGIVCPDCFWKQNKAIDPKNSKVVAQYVTAVDSNCEGVKV